MGRRSLSAGRAVGGGGAGGHDGGATGRGSDKVSGTGAAGAMGHAARTEHMWLWREGRCNQASCVNSLVLSRVYYALARPSFKTSRSRWHEMRPKLPPGKSVNGASD